MEQIFIIIGLLSPFLAAFLTYYLTVKKAKKEIDFEKARALNQVLSDLLITRFYLTRIKIIDELSSSQKNESIFPINKLPVLILNMGFLEKSNFEQLDESISKLKQFDAIIHYRLEGIGGNLELIYNNFIQPVLSGLNSTNTQIPLQTIRPILKETLESIEDNINEVVLLMGKRVRDETNNILTKSTDAEIQSVIIQLEDKYYSSMAPMLPEQDGVLMSKEKFREFSKTEEFKQVLDMQISILMNGSLNTTMELLDSNPNMSLEEIQETLANSIIKKNQ